MRPFTKPTTFYNLDVIISVGYRVKSQRGVRFRQWATRVLCEHLTQGYSLNEHRLVQRGLSAEAVGEAIAALKEQLMARGEASELFAREREAGSLASILGNLEQTMFGEPLYKTREERAAHLLYFVIKDHPFSDGNKRCGAFLFLLYLRYEDLGDFIECYNPADAGHGRRPGATTTPRAAGAATASTKS